MDGWRIDGWVVGGWLDQQVDKWIDRWTGVYMVGKQMWRMSEWMGRWMVGDRQINRQV